jgi:Tfp pilus assembly protein PilF
MDCRKGLWLALGLWGGAAGCQHAAPGLASNAPAPAATAPVDAVVTRKAAKGPKKLPKPETCVAYADYRAVEACSSNYSPSQRDQARDDARKAYQDALSLDPKCLEAQRGLARLSAAADDYPRAVAAYQKALKTAPKNASLWFELAMTYHRMQEWGAALDALGHAAALEPDNRTYVNTQAVVLARLGHYQESLECFARVNSESQAHFNLGCTLRRLAQPELSRRELEVALEENPRLESARAMLTEMTAPPVRPVGYTESQPPKAPAPETAAEPPRPSPAPEVVAESGAHAAESVEEVTLGPPQTDMNLAPPPRPPEDEPPNGDQ